MSPVKSVPPTSVKVLYWVLFLGAVSAYLLAAGQLGLSFFASRAVTCPCVEEKNGMSEKCVQDENSMDKKYVQDENSMDEK